MPERFFSFWVYFGVMYSPPSSSCWSSCRYYIDFLKSFSLAQEKLSKYKTYIDQKFLKERVQNNQRQFFNNTGHWEKCFAITQMATEQHGGKAEHHPHPTLNPPKS